MASRRKNNHVQQFATDSPHILERKLRPVYDCLDYGNYKKALQESEKVLKKHPNSATAKALKALALIRLGRVAEAQPITQSVHDTKPSDEPTLQVLTICYKEANLLLHIADMYENAVLQCPDNEEYLSHLFMAHVRLGNYKRQQQIAVKLHKLKPDNNPYYYWSVMSLVLQAAEQSAQSSMLLSLAERMAKVSRKNLATLELNAEVTLNCMILEKQGKKEQSLEILRGEMGKNLMTDEIFKQIRIAELLSDLGRVDEANALYKQLIIDRPDNYSCYTSYLSSCLKMVDSGYTPPDDSNIDCSYTVKSAEEFLIANSSLNLSSSKPQRSPMLALLELYDTLIERSVDNPEECKSNLLKCFLGYCAMFGNKPVCYKDVSKYFLRLQTSTSATDLLAKVFSSLKLEKSPDDTVFHLTNIKCIQKWILYYQLEKLSGVLNDVSTEEKVSRAQLLMSHFLHFAENVEKNVKVTDIKTCDNCLLLAVHILMDVYDATGEEKYVLQSLSWLEKGARISPATHQISLLLLYIYTSIGAYGLIPQLVSQMEIKQILYDSFGYLYSGQGMTYGHYSSACLQYDQMRKYFNGSNRDICDATIQCYKYGTFGKVEEFGRYQRRTTNSIQYATAVNEKQVLDMIFECKQYDNIVSTINFLSSVTETDTVDWDKLSDNRDIPTADSWDKVTFSEDHKLHTFNEQKHWLRYRNLSVRLIATCVNLAEGTDTDIMSTLLDTLIKDYNEQLAVWKQQEDVQVPRFTALPTRLMQEVKSGHLDVFANLIAIVKELVNIKKDAEYSPEPSLSDRFTQITEGLESCSKCFTWPHATDQPVSHKLIAEYISNLSSLTEHLSFAVVFAGIFWKFYLPVRQSNKSKRKKQGGQSKSGMSSLLTSSNSALRSHIIKLKAMLSEANTKSSCLSTDSLSNSLEQLTIEESDDRGEHAPLVQRNILISYDRSAKEITELLADKKQFLNALLGL